MTGRRAAACSTPWPRSGSSTPAGVRRRHDGRRQTVSTQITGRAGIPADAVGVVVNVTATNTTVPGFLTVFPDGGCPSR